MILACKESKNYFKHLPPVFSFKYKLTLSKVKQFLSNDFMVMGRVVIKVKLVVRTAVGPPGLSTATKNYKPCETELILLTINSLWTDRTF